MSFNALGTNIPKVELDRLATMWVEKRLGAKFHTRRHTELRNCAIKIKKLLELLREVTGGETDRDIKS